MEGRGQREWGEGEERTEGRGRGNGGKGAEGMGGRGREDGGKGERERREGEGEWDRGGSGGGEWDCRGNGGGVNWRERGERMEVVRDRREEGVCVDPP